MTRRSRTLAVVWSVLVVASLLVASVAFAGPVAAQSSQADVVFVFDKTGSMDTQAAALKEEVENVAAELDAAGIDARYGLITYESRSNTEIVQPLTGDTTALEEGLGFSTEGGTENASNGILMALDDMEYRSDAQKIVVVITDEDDDGTSAKETAIQRLDEEGACLVSVSPDNDDDDELKTMAQEVDCGEWTDVDSESFTTVVTDLVNVIKEETDPVTAAASPDFEVVEKSLEKSTVYTDETFTATVVVENTGDAGGTYRALVSDGIEILHSERETIGPGERHTFTTDISYAETGEYRVKINYRTLDYVTVVDRSLGDDEIEVTGGSVPRSTVGTGESYTVTATVENVGDYSGYATVPFASGEDGTNSTAPVANRTLELAPGESRTVEYRATAPENGSGSELSWTAAGQPLGNVSVVSADQVGVVDAYANATSVAPGESYEVTGVIYNPDDEAHLYTVAVGDEAGEPDAFRMVEVGPGESVHASWTVEAPSEAGEGTETWWFNGGSTAVDVTIGS